MTEQLLVRDLMTVGVKTCGPQTPIVDLARLILQEDLECVVVLDHEGHGIGTVSRDDLIKAYGLPDCCDLTAEDVMTDGVPQVPPDIPVTAAAQIMRDRGIRAVFMMHNAGGIIYPAAILTYTHILRHLAAQEADELNDLGIKAARQSPIETFIQKRDAARRGAQSQEE
ncbi:MAG: hypothetical protein Kow0077_17210 [Anaerolineae bacterium]